MSEHTANRAVKPVVLISTATAFSLLGDQVLYAVLPVLYQDLGLTALQVGVLLSANRWIRLLTNSLAHQAAHRFNPRVMLVAAFMLGAATTAAYANTGSFTTLLCARLLWGLAWSFIRHLGVGAIMADVPLYAAGTTMGTYNGISRMGSVAGLLGGTMLVEWLGFYDAMLTLAAISLLAAPLAARGIGEQIREKSTTRQSIAPYFLVLGVTLGAVGPGFVMSVLGAALVIHNPEEAWLSTAVLTGALLAARYLMDSVLAPVLGATFDRLGFSRATLLFLTVGGAALLLAAIAPGMITFVLAVLAFFATATALQAGVAGNASKLGSGPYALYVTASDFGAAAGPLLGWMVVAQFANPLYSVAIGGVCFVLATLAVLVRKDPPPNTAA